jgi:hypothetical protein
MTKVNKLFVKAVKIDYFLKKMFESKG